MADILFKMVLKNSFAIVDDVPEAYNLIKDLEPTTPQEYILKGVVNAALGQDQGSVCYFIIMNIDYFCHIFTRNWNWQLFSFQLSNQGVNT